MFRTSYRERTANTRGLNLCKRGLISTELPNVWSIGSFRELSHYLIVLGCLFGNQFHGRNIPLVWRSVQENAAITSSVRIFVYTNYCSESDKKRKLVGHLLTVDRFNFSNRYPIRTFRIEFICFNNDC